MAGSMILESGKLEACKCLLQLVFLTVAQIDPTNFILTLEVNKLLLGSGQTTNSGLRLIVRSFKSSKNYIGRTKCILGGIKKCLLGIFDLLFQFNSGRINPFKGII